MPKLQAKKIKRFFSRHWLMMVVYSCAALVVAMIYGYGLRTFLPGMSPAEVQTVQNARFFSAIIKNPLWLPYKLICYAWAHLGFSALSFRYINALLAALVLYAFYTICRRWYSARISTLTTCLFALNSTTLTLARVATPALLLYTWMIITAVILWLHTTRRVRVSPFVALVAVGIAAYIPGAVWFIAFLLIWFRKSIIPYFKKAKPWMIAIGATLGLLTMAPLAYAFFHHHHLALDWLLLPSTISLHDSLFALRDAPAAFFYRTLPNPAYNLGRLPLLDAFSGTTLLVGLYAYRSRLRLDRTIVYVLAAIVSIGLAVINNNQFYLVMLLPFVYLMIGGGMSYLLNQWREVFPRNPLARFIGTLILSLVVFSACLYHMNRYFLAWQNAPSTKAIYNQRLK